MNFTTKLILLSVGSLLSVAIPLYGLFSYTSGQALEQEIRTRLQEQTAHIMDKLDRMLFERYADMQLMASRIRSYEEIKNHPQGITEQLLVHRQYYKAYYSLSFYDTHRLRIADTTGLSIGQRAEPSPWVDQVFEKGLASIGSDIHFDPELGKTVVYFALPVRDEQKNVFLGAVVARMPVENLYYTVGGVNDPWVRLDLFDVTGKVLFSTHDKASIGQQLLSELTLEHIMARFGQNTFYTISEEPGYLDFRGNRWILVAHYPIKEALATVIALRTKILLIGFFLLLGVIGVTLWLAHRIIKPILMLKEAATKLAQGEFQVTVPVISKDEIGQLAEAFNHMARGLDQNTQTLRDQEVMLKETQKIACVGGWKIDLLTHKLNWTEGVFSIYGLPLEQGEPSYEALTELIHPEDRDLHHNQVIESIIANKPFDFVYRIMRDQEIRYIHARGMTICNVQEQVIRLYGAVVDITERQRAEVLLKEYNQRLEQEVTMQTKELAAMNEELQTQSEELLRKNHLLEEEILKRQGVEQSLIEAKEIAEHAQIQAEIANRAKSSFLANMSHELRTPLNGILGYAQILIRDKTMTTKQQEGAEVIRRSGEYLLTLINDILDLAKIEAGKIEFYPIDFNFDEFIQGINELFYIRAQQKVISFIYQPFSHLPLWVHADEKRLRQILINLLGNAVKFTEQGGVTFKVGYEGDLLCFQIEDTGIGIAPEDIEKIFKPFQQVGNSHHKTEGTGLGLSITKKLIDMMGGELRIHSAFGHGSTFSVLLHLPEVPELIKAKSLHGPNIIGLKGPPRKILVIDDKWENRLVMSHLLTPLGFDIIEANNGQEGLETAQRIHPDLILIDLVMPVMDGFEATRCLRKLPEFESLPIIAVSASVFDHHQQQSKTAGCDDFLAKPFRTENLLELLYKYLNIEWNYEQESIVVPPVPEQELETIDEMIKPSPQQATILYDLAMRGDIAEILKKIDELEIENPKLNPFLEKVRHLAKGFEEIKICELIEQCLPRESMSSI